MHQRCLPLKWSIEKNKKKTREQSAMARTKIEARMVTADVNHDPAAKERATKSVADSMNATRNSSSQGNKKKKRKKELPAMAAKADNVQDLSGNGSKQVTVGKTAEIRHDLEVQAIKPESKLNPVVDPPVEADAPCKNKSVANSCLKLKKTCFYNKNIYFRNSYTILHKRLLLPMDQEFTSS